MMNNTNTNAPFCSEQVADDHGFGDYHDRIVLPDGTLAYVGQDYLTGSPIAYRKRVCCDYGGNVLATRSADESCVGISHGRLPSIVSHSGRVPGLKITYVGPAQDCTGRQIYHVHVESEVRS